MITDIFVRSAARFWEGARHAWQNDCSDCRRGTGRGCGGAYLAFKDDITAAWDQFHVKIAEYPQPKKTVWLDQGISKEKLSWYYHADQGTRTFGFPYEWFMALEQPTIPWLVFNKVGDFSETAYLDRYGFIPDTVIPGKKALPIGLARGRSDAGPHGRAVEEPAHQGDHERNRPDLRGLSYRTLHLQGHGRHHRRRAGAHQSVQDEAGHGRLPAADAFYPDPVQPVRRKYPGTGIHRSPNARR